MVEERGRLVSHKEELQEQDEKLRRAVVLNSCMYSYKATRSFTRPGWNASPMQVILVCEQSPTHTRRAERNVLPQTC